MNGRNTNPKTSRIATRGIHIIGDDDEDDDPVLVVEFLLLLLFLFRRIPHPKQQKHPHVSTAIVTVMAVYTK